MSFPAPQIPFKCGIRGRMGDLNGLLLLFPRLPFPPPPFHAYMRAAAAAKAEGREKRGGVMTNSEEGGETILPFPVFFSPFIRVRHALTEEEGKTFFPRSREIDKSQFLFLLYLPPRRQGRGGGGGSNGRYQNRIFCSFSSSVGKTRFTELAQCLFCVLWRRLRLCRVFY